MSSGTVESDPVAVAGAGQLARATDVVGRRLLGAAYRERLAAVEAGAPVRRHGFGRVEWAAPVREEPRHLLTRLGVDSPSLAAEVHDARDNLAVAYARRGSIVAQLRGAARRLDAARSGEVDQRESSMIDLYQVAVGLPAGEQALLFERLATDGHNLHPCGRTRLGWSPRDVLRYDLESPGFPVAFLAVREDLHLGDDVGAALRRWYPHLPAPPAGFRSQPVHPWQLDTVRQRYPDMFHAGVLRVLDAWLPAVPTVALRTVALAPDAAGVRHYLKLSLDILVTSTRRGISVASTRNGPVISQLLRQVLRGHPRVSLLPEVAGGAVPACGRDLAAILRGGLPPGAPGEVAVPAAALPAISPLSGRTVLAELVDRYPGSALEFLQAYARLLLPPVLHLAQLGVGLEAHLQNSVPIFAGGVPSRIAFRDFAGLRLHLPRLRERAGQSVRLWPGSVVGTDDLAVLRAKAGYTALQAHLGELVTQLAGTGDVDEKEAWQGVRAVLDDVPADPRDRAFFTARQVPHKALLRMRLAPEGGDQYLPVDNPLHEGWAG